MNAPLYQFGLFGNDTALLLAVPIGIGFGFFLEQAGFGSSVKLAQQFYLRDLTVFKVMFTAIVTAMLGLFWLSWIGFVDLSLVRVLPTYLVPQLAGGLVFGVGFVMGGYCPGTCCVAAVTGKMDGWTHLTGIIIVAQDHIEQVLPHVFFEGSHVIVAIISLRFTQLCGNFADKKLQCPADAHGR